MADQALAIFKEHASLLQTPLAAVFYKVHFFNLLVVNFKNHIKKHGLPEELNEEFVDMIYTQSIAMVTERFSH